jgi:hypothetical protein
MLSGPPLPLVPPPSSGAAAPGVLTMSYHNQLFNTLNVVTNNNDCLLNIKERGLLPVVADVLTNAGLMAAIMPTPNGLLLGVAGLTFGSSLKVLHKLFKAPFSWGKTGDRKQFLDLNCTFFDVRRDIEAAELFDLKDEHLEEHVAEIKSQLEAVRQRLAGIKKRALGFEQEVHEKKRQFLMLRLGQDALSLLEVLEAFLKTAPQLAELAWLHQAMETFPPVKTYISAMKQRPAYGNYLLDQLQPFTWPKLETHVRSDSSLFAKVYRAPLEFYLGKLAEDLGQSIERELEVFWSLPAGGGSTKSNRHVYEHMQEVFATVMGKLSETLARLEARIKILEAKNPKRTFAPYDEGAHAAYDIIDEYLYIQRKLFGSLGFKFTHYFTKELEKQLASFSHFYEQVKAHLRTPGLSSGELMWACRNANQLRIIWERAHTAAEVANDFFETNRGLFHTNYRTVRWLLLASYPHRLYKLLRSSEYAKEVITKKRVFDPHEVEEFSWESRHNVGRLMVKLIASEPEREEVEAFWETNKCLTYL